jgi:hypothetical protein
MKNALDIAARARPCANRDVLRVYNEAAALTTNLLSLKILTPSLQF